MIDALLKNKRAAGRAVDRQDVRELEALHKLAPSKPKKKATKKTTKKAAKKSPAKKG